MERTPVEHIEEYIKNKQALGHRFGVNDLLDVIKEAKQMENELSKLHQPSVSVSVCDCRHIFLQQDSQWQKCAKCGMIAPLQTVR